MQKIIFQISGGLGKHVAATAVIKAIKRQYPESYLIVISSFPIVFRNNPLVDKNLGLGELLGFYDNFIAGSQPKPLFMLREPYNEADFLNREGGHLNKIWATSLGVKWENEMPDVFLTDMEAERIGPSFRADNGKPLFVMQTHGGPAPQDLSKPNPHPYSWARDIPAVTAQKVVDVFKDEYNILHIRRKDQPALQGTYPVSDVDFRYMACLIAMSDLRLFMDSFAQHTAAALRKPSVVCWIANTPEQFGYDIHDNIVAPPGTIKPDTRNSVFLQYDITGADIQCPYASLSDILDADRIIAALRNIGHKNGVAHNAPKGILAAK